MELDRLNTSLVSTIDYVQSDESGVKPMQGDEMSGFASFDRQVRSSQFGRQE
ncbi:hypothetical protein ACOSOMT5_P1032 [Acidiphilium sp. MT5]